MSYERPTRADVERLLVNYSELVTGAGLVRPGFRLVLEEGNKTYGRAWRLFETLADQSGGGYHRPLIGDDFLGMTAREAHAALSARLRTVSDVLYVQKTGAA